tara:strand:+ start:159 stop:359 length:201 start_codon:yes stop_codon:yes gene_type:complete
MKPKEKAKELVDIFAKEAHNFNENTEYDYDKQCALICADEVLKVESNYFPNKIGYWPEVKKEINKL